MREIGQAGQRGLTRAQSHIRHQFLGGPTPAELENVVDTTAEPPHAASRTRVSDDEEIEAEIERELDDATATLEQRFERRR